MVGLTPYRNLDLGSTGQVLKADRTLVHFYYLYNNALSTRYVKFYDKATAGLSTDTPLWTIPIPPGAAANVYLGWELAMAFTAGLSLRATTGVADNDTGAPSSNDVVVNIGFS